MKTEDALDRREHHAEVNFVYEQFHQLCRERNVVDFTDLIDIATKLLTQCARVRKLLHATHQYILVDEFQDTSVSQYAFLKALVGRRSSVTVVGDDDQSIFGFQGADFRNFRRFLSDFAPDAGQDPRAAVNVVKLQENYRSSAHIVRSASYLIQRNSSRLEHKTLTTSIAVEDSNFVRVVECRSHEVEVGMICSMISHLISIGRIRGLSDVAVLSRTNRVGQSFRDAFSEKGIRIASQGALDQEMGLLESVVAILRITSNEYEPSDVWNMIKCLKLEARKASLHRDTEVLLERGARDLGAPLIDFFRK
eukprot:scaffold2514_cov205-Pinguiococcus_pyrenoidosus.AAC.1